MLFWGSNTPEVPVILDVCLMSGPEFDWSHRRQTMESCVV